MRLIVRTAAWVLVLVLLILMLVPRVHAPGPEQYADKVWHVVGFLAITLALQVGPVWRDRVGAALLAVLIGAGVEVAQDFVGRDRSLLDLVADAVGAGIGWWISPRLAPLMGWLERRS
jgi:VanZ family protein